MTHGPNPRSISHHPTPRQGASHGALSSLDDHQAIVRPAFGGSQHGRGGNNSHPSKRLLGNGSSAGRRSSTGSGQGPSFLRGGGGNAPLGHGSMHRGLAAAAAAAKRDGGRAMSAADARVAKVSGAWMVHARSFLDCWFDY